MDRRENSSHAASANADSALAFQRETRWLKLGFVASVSLLIGGTVMWIILTKPQNPGWIFGQMLFLSAVPGKTTILSGLAPGSPLTPWELLVLSTNIDLVIALGLALGLGWLGKFPWAERTIKRMHDQASAALHTYPRLRRMCFWGVVFFVFLPLPASGAIGGTCAGQIVGLSRTVGFGAVMLGGAMIGIIFASLATFMGSQAKAILENPWWVGTSTVIFVLFVYVAWRKMRVALRS
jgi:uncharacterized membrane protein